MGSGCISVLNFGGGVFLGGEGFWTEGMGCWAVWGEVCFGGD